MVENLSPGWDICESLIYSFDENLPHYISFLHVVPCKSNCPWWLTHRLRTDNLGAMNSSPTRTDSRFGLNDQFSFVSDYWLSTGFYTSEGLFLQHSAQYATLPHQDQQNNKYWRKYIVACHQRTDSIVSHAFWYQQSAQYRQGTAVGPVQTPEAPHATTVALMTCPLLP